MTARPQAVANSTALLVNGVVPGGRVQNTVETVQTLIRSIYPQLPVNTKTAAMLKYPGKR